MNRTQFVVRNTPDNKTEKTVAGAIETESFALAKYFKLIAEGQTIAIEMLFAKPIMQTSVWEEIYKHRSRLVSRKSAAFIGYCKAQASKYGIKGSRVASARRALNMLEYWIEGATRNTKLLNFARPIEDTTAVTDHMNIVDIPHVSGTMIKHWKVCNCKLPYTITIGYAHELIKKIVDNYGQRALQAEKNEGLDWKALSHAVRVGMQAIDLYTTGELKFPLSYAGHLLDIKLAKLPYQTVAEEIEMLLVDVEDCAAKSSLPKTADEQWIEDFIFDTYSKHISGGIDLKAIL